MYTSNFSHRLSSELQNRKTRSLYRQRYSSIPNGRTITIEGKTYLNFSGNDYLGLSRHPDVQDAYSHGVDSLGCGSTGSALINGYHPIHDTLENKLAEWLGFESTLLFSTGFSANSSLLKTLFGKDDLIVQDKLNHASLIDGGLMSDARSIRFNHNDMSHLQLRLNNSARNKIIVSEGVFSMDGDQAHIQQINQIAEQENALFMLDDAHGIGVFGKEGQGTWQASQCKPDILMATFGKAFGLSGAFIAAKREVIDYLVQFSRSYVYSTAMSPAQANAISKTIDIIKKADWRRDKLQQSIAQFRNAFKDTNIQLLDSDSAIQPIIVGSADHALAYAKKLRENGIWLTAIRPPTVAENSSRLRITLTTEHTAEDITFLTSLIKKVFNDT
ncbi:8-amino-7-oxononanoate synthase [Algibacillus agarilyticus]|uniref:8-amino-7-oxononanoate synthase n=1 Tax=Algibacillus agarilyticus TaxID=2234133 RepID=UPI000DD0C117|nr:8-amino-7-oxononanoate synthase [Algibacillus agarilyticus]